MVRASVPLQSNIACASADVEWIGYYKGKRLQSARHPLDLELRLPPAPGEFCGIGANDH
jgi:hypothetical protein